MKDPDSIGGISSLALENSVVPSTIQHPYDETELRAGLVGVAREIYEALRELPPTAHWSAGPSTRL